MIENNTSLPEEFLKRIQKQITDISEFVSELEQDAPTFIRLNKQKVTRAEHLPEGEGVKWNSLGLKLKERPKFSQDPLYHAGLYYPMEASSMFLDYVLQQIELSGGGTILDLCAAPGGKTLITKDRFPDNFLVSNEIELKRAHILKENVVRWGTNEHLVINSDARKLAKGSTRYELIIVDAPCSGEGLFRKDERSRGEWTLERARGCAFRQTEILEDALTLLEDGGYIVYSTCTYNPDENLKQIERLIDSGNFSSLDIEVPSEWKIEKIENNGAIGYQFWPHRLEGEGFFISIVRNTKTPVIENGKIKVPKLKEISLKLPSGIELRDKYMVDLKGNFFAFSEKEWAIYHDLMQCGQVVKKGLFLGELKGNDFIPSHDLSTHPAAYNFTNKIELNLEQALDYLKGNALILSTEKGVVLLTFNGLAIGFGKSNGQRINNLFPKHLRIN